MLKLDVLTTGYFNHWWEKSFWELKVRPYGKAKYSEAREVDVA